MTAVNDIVLIYLEDKPVSFARVESIFPDHKKDWFQIKLLMLQLPLQVVTWILKDDYINGTQFHMNGQRMRLEKVVCPDTAFSEASPSPREVKEKTGASRKSSDNIVSLSAFRKKKE